MDQRAGRVRQADCLGDRLDHAGLVVDPHHRDQGRLVARRQPALQIREIEPALGIDRDSLGPLGRRQHRVVLDRRHQQPRPAAAADRQRIGLGAAGREHHLLRRSVEQRRDLPPRGLHPAACGPARRVHRGRVSDRLRRLGHGVQGRRPDRGGSVVVEVDGTAHRPVVPCRTRRFASNQAAKPAFT
jgi:hypothetical protein